MPYTVLHRIFSFLWEVITNIINFPCRKENENDLRKTYFFIFYNINARVHIIVFLQLHHICQLAPSKPLSLKNTRTNEDVLACNVLCK